MRPVTAADFTSAKEKRWVSRRPGEWWVGKYDLIDEAIVDVSSCVSEWRMYKPLEEVPDLFFTFARLFEAEDFAASALEWVRRYGFPKEFYYWDNEDRDRWSFSDILVSQTLRNDAPSEKLRSVLSGHEVDSTLSSWKESRRVPPSVTLEELRKECRSAWSTLANYEAYLDDDPKRALYLPNGNPVNPADVEARKLLPEGRFEQIFLGWARVGIEEAITKQIYKHCRFEPLESEFLTPKSKASKWAWNFYDLRGAMYLQMMWVMEEGIKIRRCKMCGKDISKPLSAKSREVKVRKVHSNKKFCGPACRMRHYRAKPSVAAG